jgi:hypothetical protein
MRSKFNFFMRSKLQSWDQHSTFHEIRFVQKYWSGGQHFDHEIKTLKSIITNFDLMNILLVTSLIMRSKLKSIVREFWAHDQFVSRKCDNEIE